MRASKLATACGGSRTPPMARQSLGACEPLFVPARNPGLLLYTSVVSFVIHVTGISSDWVMSLCHFRFLLTFFFHFSTSVPPLARCRLGKVGLWIERETVCLVLATLLGNQMSGCARRMPGDLNYGAWAVTASLCVWLPSLTSFNLPLNYISNEKH